MVKIVILQHSSREISEMDDPQLIFSAG